MTNLAPEIALEDRGEAKAVETPSTTRKSPARPEAPEGAGAANGGTPVKRSAGRPLGAKAKGKLLIRNWLSPKARKLTLKQIQIANKIFDAALAGEKVADSRLDFAANVARQAREYSFGKPTEHREISGPDGGPITTEALLPMEAMQRFGALFAAHQAQPAAPAEAPGPPVIDVTPETIDGPEKRAEGVGGAEPGRAGSGRP